MASRTRSGEPRIRGHLADAREDAIRLAQENHTIAYVRCVRSGYFASLECGRNPIATFDPARLPALPVCSLEKRGWLTGLAPKSHGGKCRGCGRKVYTKSDGTCTPHAPLTRKAVPAR